MGTSAVTCQSRKLSVDSISDATPNPFIPAPDKQKHDTRSQTLPVTQEARGWGGGGGVDRERGLFISP